MLTYEQAGRIIVSELGENGYEFSTDPNGSKVSDKKSTGLYFFKRFENYSYRIEVGAGLNRIIGFGLGVSHYLRLSNFDIEAIYCNAMDRSRYFSAGLNEFKPNQSTVHLMSKNQPEFKKYLGYDESTLVEHAIPLLRETFSELEQKVSENLTPEAIYTRMESCASYRAMDSYIGGFLPIRRLILKAWVKDPKFHDYAQHMIELYEGFAKKGSPKVALLLEAIKTTYQATTKLYEDPTHEHMPVEYKNAIYYSDY